MRRFFQIFFVVMALSMAFDASAQQVVKKRIGVYQQNGNVEIAEATTTDPTCLILFLPSFCFSNNFFFLVISPP